jgi:hypothetical protein
MEETSPTAQATATAIASAGAASPPAAAKPPPANNDKRMGKLEQNVRAEKRARAAQGDMPLSLFCSTFNINGVALDKSVASQLYGAGKGCDLLCLAFQECLSAVHCHDLANSAVTEEDFEVGGRRKFAKEGYLRGVPDGEGEEALVTAVLDVVGRENYEAIMPSLNRLP